MSYDDHFLADGTGIGIIDAVSTIEVIKEVVAKDVDDEAAAKVADDTQDWSMGSFPAPSFGPSQTARDAEGTKACASTPPSPSPHRSPERRRHHHWQRRTSAASASSCSASSSGGEKSGEELEVSLGSRAGVEETAALATAEDCPGGEEDVLGLIAAAVEASATAASMAAARKPTNMEEDRKEGGGDKVEGGSGGVNVATQGLGQYRNLMEDKEFSKDQEENKSSQAISPAPQSSRAPVSREDAPEDTRQTHVNMVHRDSKPPNQEGAHEKVVASALQMSYQVLDDREDAASGGVLLGVVPSGVQERSANGGLESAPMGSLGGYHNGAPSSGDSESPEVAMSSSLEEEWAGPCEESATKHGSGCEGQVPIDPEDTSVSSDTASRYDDEDGIPSGSDGEDCSHSEEEDQGPQPLCHEELHGSSVFEAIAMISYASSASSGSGSCTGSGSGFSSGGSYSTGSSTGSYNEEGGSRSVPYSKGKGEDEFLPFSSKIQYTEEGMPSLQSTHEDEDDLSNKHAEEDCDLVYTLEDNSASKNESCDDSRGSKGIFAFLKNFDREIQVSPEHDSGMPSSHAKPWRSYTESAP